jgi:hypothetical protein
MFTEKNVKITDFENRRWMKVPEDGVQGRVLR